MLIPEYLSVFRKSYKNFLRGGRISRADVEDVVFLYLGATFFLEIIKITN